jgi:hypothetical protein
MGLKGKRLNNNKSHKDNNKSHKDNNKEVCSTVKHEIIMPSGQRRGFEEGVTKEELIIPRAKLLQALSPEVTDGMKSPDGKDLKIGMVVNSLTREILPSEFIPIFKFTNWIRFNPRNDKDPNFDATFEPGAIIWRSNDPSDPKVQSEGAFGPNGEVPIATKFINFFCYFPGVPMPIIVGFSKTSYKAGRQLLSLAKFTPGDMFSRKYALTSKQVKSEFTYQVLEVSPAGIPAESDYKFAECLWDEYASKAKDIKVHDEEGAGDEESEAVEKAPY